MNDVIKMGKKIFTVSVVAVTMMWSLGVAALVPAVANAATCPTLAAGDMIKVVGKPAIYAVNNDSKVLYFPSGDEFKSWRPTYGGYISITQDCFDSLSVPSTYPGAVNYHPGSYVVKRPSSDQLYVVEPNNTLAKITPAAALALYGNAYKVMTVADTFWPHYVNRGDDVISAIAHPGMLVTVNAITYYIDAGNVMRQVTATGMTANGFQTRFVHSLPNTAISGFTTGAIIDAEVKALTDKTQSGGVIPGPVVTGGAVTVALAADSPASMTLASGSAYNDVLKLNLTAGSQTVKVTGITLTKFGLLANTKIAGVSVWDKDANRHGDVMTSLTSDNKVTVGFGSYPILIAPGTTETLLVRVNLGAGSYSGNFGFRLAVSSDLKTDGTVGGVFPADSNTMNIVDGSTSLGAYGISAVAVGGITDGTQSTANGNMAVGDLQKEIGRFRFTESSGNEDLVLSRIVFYLEGSIQDKDLTNFTVYAPDNTILGTAAVSSDRYVTVKFTNNYTIPKSTSKDFSLKADVANGSTRYVRVHIQNDSDVMVKGVSTGFYITPTSFTDQKTTSDWFKVQSGSMTLSKTANSPSGNISAGASSIVLGKFDVKAVGEDLEVRKMGLAVATSTSNSKYLTGNVVVQDATTGDTYLTVAGNTAALYTGGAQYNLSSYISIPAGQTKTLTVLGSIDSTATGSSDYTISVGDFYAKRLSTLDFADQLGSATINVAANKMTVSATNMTLNKDTSMGSVTRSKGSTVVVGQFVAQAGTAEDVRFTGMNFSFSSTNGLIAANTYQNLALYDSNGIQLGNTVSSVASSSNSFTFDVAIPANSTKVFVLKALVASSASNGNLTSNVDTYTYVGKNTGNSNTGTNVQGQTVTIGSATAGLTAVSDGSTASKIYGPSGTTQVQVGKWKLQANNEGLTLNKITFEVVNDSLVADTNSGNWGTFSLYDGSTLLGTGTYVAGYVSFTGLTVSVDVDSYKVLTLKCTINGSGTMDSGHINAIVIKSNSNTDMEIRSQSGSLLATSAINGGAVSNYATSSFYKFDDAYPTIAAASLGSSLSLGSASQIFKYTVTNSGTRDMRFASTTITVNAAGLATGGSIGTFKLYEANDAGGLGTLLASNSTVTLTSTTTSVSPVFNVGNQSNGMLADFEIAPGATRTFIVVADTTNATVGKSTGMVSVSAKIGGSTGWSGTAWNTGNWFYQYTPVNGSPVAITSDCDNYEVLGGTLSISM